MCINSALFSFFAVPRKILIDRFESNPEADEPLPFDDDNELEQEEIYDEEQFYKESESPGPAPKLQGDLSKKPQRVDSDVPSTVSSSSLTPPQPAKDESPLNGKCLIIFFHREN